MEEHSELPKTEEHQAEQPAAAHEEKPAKKGPPMLLVIIALIVILGLGGWLISRYLSTKSTQTTPTEMKKETKLYPGKIIIGYVTWPGYLGLFLARDKGYFKEAGIDIELRLYQDILQGQKDYAAGKIQGIINVPLATVGGISGTDETISQKIVLATDYSNGADGIIAKPGIATIKDLKGKKLAYQKGTIEEAFAKYALEQYQMTAADVTVIDLDPIAAADALTKGQVDAATTYEPFLTKTASDIKGKVIYTSAEAPGLITDIVTFRSYFINQYPDSVAAVVKGYVKGIRFWQQNPQEAHALLAKELGGTPEDVAAQLKTIKILGQEENETAFTYASGLQSLYGNLTQMTKLGTGSAGQTTKDTDQLIEPKFIKSLSQ